MPKDKRCKGCKKENVFPHPSIKWYCEKCGDKTPQAPKGVSEFPPRMWLDIELLDDSGTVEASTFKLGGDTKYLSIAEHTALLKAVVEERDALLEALEDSGEQLSIAHDVLNHCQENSCCPTKEEVIQCENAKNEARAALLRDGEKIDE